MYMVPLLCLMFVRYILCLLGCVILLFGFSFWKLFSVVFIFFHWCLWLAIVTWVICSQGITKHTESFNGSQLPKFKSCSNQCFCIVRTYVYKQMFLWVLSSCIVDGIELNIGNSIQIVEMMMMIFNCVKRYSFSTRFYWFKEDSSIWRSVKTIHGPLSNLRTGITGDYKHFFS